VEFEHNPRPAELPRPLTYPERVDILGERVDLLGVTTKLIESGGLVLALRLLGTHAGGAASLPALHQGAGHE
jgi:hypothetical protein